MARLCDPDINIIVLKGCTSPEPAIRDMIVHYYESHGFSMKEACDITTELLSEHNEICNKSLST